VTGTLHEYLRKFMILLSLLGVWGSVLVGRSRDRSPVVSLDFSVTYFLQTVPWP
jgi:hypothetical protein